MRNAWVLGPEVARRVASLRLRYGAVAAGESFDTVRIGGGEHDPALPLPSWVPLQGPSPDGLCPLLPAAASLETLARAAAASASGPPLSRLGVTDEGVAVHVRWTQATPWLAARVAVGLSTLFAAAPALQRIWQALVVHVVPLVVTSPALTPRYGFSSHHLKGYVFLSFPAGEAVKDTIEDSLSLAHELGHQVLMAYQTADPVLASDQDAPVYSAIRRGFRPAILALHGAMALGYMTYTAECLGSAAARGYRDGLRRTLLGMRAAGCIYTELGSLLVSELEELAWP